MPQVALGLATLVISRVYKTGPVHCLSPPSPNKINAFPARLFQWELREKQVPPLRIIRSAKRCSGLGTIAQWMQKVDVR